MERSAPRPKWNAHGATVVAVLLGLLAGSLNEAASRAPVGELVDIDDVGYACAYLATPYARRMTGQTPYVDGGVNIMA